VQGHYVLKRSRYNVGWTYEAIGRHHASRTLPHTHHVVCNITPSCDLVFASISHDLFASSRGQIPNTHASAESHLQDWDFTCLGLLSLYKKSPVSTHFPRNRYAGQPGHVAILVVGIRI